MRTMTQRMVSLPELHQTGRSGSKRWWRTEDILVAPEFVVSIRAHNVRGSEVKMLDGQRLRIDGSPVEVARMLGVAP